MTKNILIGCNVYTINPGCRKLELVCIDMYIKFKSTIEKHDFVSMFDAFSKHTLQKICKSTKETMKYLKKCLPIICQ